MQNYLINYKKNIRECLLQLEKNEQKCLIVVNDRKQIKGTLTDGDIRRALLRNANLDSKCID
jgi:predicted transcriptional regulator